VAVAALTVVPVLIMEGSYNYYAGNNSADHQHPSRLFHFSKAVQHEAAGMLSPLKNTMDKNGAAAIVDGLNNLENNGEDINEDNNRNQQVLDGNPGNDSEEDEPASPLVRGVNKLPLSRTPSLIGASRGHVQCDVPVDEERFSYWNSPQGDRDQAFQSPFRPDDADTKDYYITFQPDRGGWNNIRMSMEILFVMAAATGRTLVLPPKVPLYLLGHGKEGARGFGDFFPLHNPELLKKIKIISMKEFIEKEAPKWDGLSKDELERLIRVSELCLHKEKDDLDCEFLHEQLRNRGFQPDIKPPDNCYIFDEDFLKQSKLDKSSLNAEQPTPQLSDELQLEVDRFCGPHRKPVFYDKNLQAVPFIHWDAGCDSVTLKDTKHCFRLLQHFYTFMYFSDPKIDNYYKRFVRDFLHYNDDVNCAAWKVIQAVQKDADELNVPWSTWHVRRGDLQYKKVKISAEEWYENTKEVWSPGELLYIATDERNKKFFDPVKAKNHPVRFLDDYWEIAGMDKLDKSYIGMVDTIVASHGRAFAGTWFSTFTGYINRLRGYLGKSMKDSWYSYLPRKDVMREFAYPDGNYVAREWHIGWVAIDADEHIDFEQGVAATDIHDEKAKLLQQLPVKKKADDKPIKYDVRPMIHTSQINLMTRRDCHNCNFNFLTRFPCFWYVEN